MKNTQKSFITGTVLCLLASPAFSPAALADADLLLPISEELYISSQLNMEVIGTDSVCAERIGRATYDAMNERFRYDEAGLDTVSIEKIELLGDKASFDFINVFRVSATDETDPSAWLVVTETEDCVVEVIRAGSDSDR